MDGWNADKILRKYVHDYMLKQKLYRTAEIFAREADVVLGDVAINPPEGFLAEWWSLFWDICGAKLHALYFGKGEQAAEATGNVAQNAAIENAATENVAQNGAGAAQINTGAIPPSPDQMNSLAFGTMLQSLFSTMPMSEMIQQAVNVMQTAMANSAMDQENVTAAIQPLISNQVMSQSTVTFQQPPIPNPAMKQQHTVGLMQSSSSTPNLAMNHQAVGVMNPSSSIRNLAMNEQAVNVMQPSGSIPNLAMNQHAMGVVQPNSIPFNQPAFGLMQPLRSMNQQDMGVIRPLGPIRMNQQAMGVMHSPSSIPMNQQAMGVMQSPSSIPMNQRAMGLMQSPSPIRVNQQAMSRMQPPSPIPMNQQAMGVMPPPRSIPMSQQAMGIMQMPTSSEIRQQMLAKIPHELQGEPVSILLQSMYEQDCLRRSARDLAARVQQLDGAKMNPMLASSSRSSYLPQQNAETLHQWLGREGKRPTTVERSNAVLPASVGASQALELPDAGRNDGIQQVPVTGHITDVGLVSPGLGNQVSSSFGTLQNQQLQFAPSGGHHQVDTLPALAAQNSPYLTSSASGSSPNPATPMVIDDFKGKGLQMPDDAQSQAPAGQTMPNQEQNYMLLQQNSNENVRKRKIDESSSAVDNALDGKEAEKEKSMDEDVDDDGYFAEGSDTIDDMAILWSTFQEQSSGQFISEPEGFSFKEAKRLHAPNNKLLSCHFSSSGKILAGAGHEKKVLLWNMEDYKLKTVATGHSDIITDVRFRPHSTVFGTSSCDKTVLIWDAYKRNKPLYRLAGHTEHVMTLDFHPRKMDLLCSCDSGNDLWYWNIDNASCTDISKGAGRQGRFQPRLGDLFAAVSGNSINLIDVETKRTIRQLQGHMKDIRSFCWDNSGQYVAAVSEDRAIIWTIKSDGYPLNTLTWTDRNTFESCTFHPAYSHVVVIGSNPTIQFWNAADRNKTWSYQAHEGIVAALADSPYTETVASASHDQYLKVWKS